jgi:hypothetical protein
MYLVLCFRVAVAQLLFRMQVAVVYAHGGVYPRNRSLPFPLKWVHIPKCSSSFWEILADLALCKKHV